MRFAFDEQQREFQAQWRAFLDKQCTVADVRRAWASETGWSRRRWEALAEMGVAGLTVPAEYGGLGLGLVDLVLLLEEAGRAGLPEPLLETTALAVPLLAALARRSGGAAAPWLAEVAGGALVAAVGTDSTSAVPAAAGADLFLLGRGDEILAVASAAVTSEPRPALDGTRRPAFVRFDPAAATVLCSGAAAAADMAALGDRAAAGSGAVLVGLAERMLSMAAGYAVDRRQFGKPIGSFQAVKHLLANAAVAVEFARPVVYRAAWSIDQGDPEASLHASMAKAKASDAATLAARVALQVHGAIGYTWEHDLHLWMKRAWALARAWGDASEHRARILDLARARS